MSWPVIGACGDKYYSLQIESVSEIYGPFNVCVEFGGGMGAGGHRVGDYIGLPLAGSEFSRVFSHFAV